MSLRAARVTTRPPRHAINSAKNATFPHWPGDTQAWPVSSITTIPKFVGLNRCWPSMRITNLLATVTTAATTASSKELVRSSRHKDSPEMRALRGSKAGVADLEIEPCQSIGQKCCQDSDLIVARVRLHQHDAPREAVPQATVSDP
jgi:hypothetical protein